MSVKYLEGYMVRTEIGCGEGKRFTYMEEGDTFDIVVFPTRELAEQAAKIDAKPIKWSHTVALSWTTANPNHAKGMQLWADMTEDQLATKEIPS